MHNKMYNKISSALQQVLPNNWEDVVLYSHIKDDCYEYKFYVRVNGEYILCFKLEQAERFVNETDGVILTRKEDGNKTR